MNFKRKQRIKGRSAKTYKEWYDETKQYRVSWRKEAFGVAVTPGYFACVRCVGESGEEYWGFVGRRGLYRSLTAAMDACEKNEKIWNKFLVIEGRAKVRQLRELKEYAIFGTGKSAYSMMAEHPVWMVKQASDRLMEILCGKHQNDTTETSKSSDSPSVPSQVDQSGPASIVSDAGPSTTNTAKHAKAPAKGRRKKSSKSTSASSKTGRKKSGNTKRGVKGSSKSRKKRSPNSRKKK
jgi:hypothetical protein